MHTFQGENHWTGSDWSKGKRIQSFPEVNVPDSVLLKKMFSFHYIVHPYHISIISK